MSKTKDTITKLKLFLDFDKEIEYINKMNRNGWKLVYIKGGCLYTFVKTEPDEYFTVLYCEKKENISQISTFAAQCGYENIPHTMDGLGDLLYLTGKKNEISEEFVSDISTLIEINTKIKKKFSLMTIILAVVNVLLILESAFFIADMFLFPEDIYYTIPTAIFITVFAAIYSPITIVMMRICGKYKNKIKKLEAELTIYE